MVCVVWKKYALTLGVWKTKFPVTCHPEGIYSGTHRLKSTCHCMYCLDATNLDTHRPEEICPYTLRLEGKMPWH